MVSRLVVVVGLVVLAFGIWALWPRGEPDTTPSTTVVAAPTTTTSSPATTPSTTTAPTTTTSESSHVVTTVEEAEVILRELWFGWFEGIYNQDEERIKEVVGSQTALDNAREQFGVMTFERPPQAGDISFEATEILRTDSSCLVAYTTILLAGFREGATTGVHVLRSFDQTWVSVGLWERKGDLWEADCDSSLELLS